jgi:hypothetical protein
MWSLWDRDLRYASINQLIIFNKFYKNYVIISGTAAVDFLGDTLENFGDTQMGRNTRFEKHCLRQTLPKYVTNHQN